MVGEVDRPPRASATVFFSRGKFPRRERHEQGRVCIGKQDGASESSFSSLRLTRALYEVVGSVGFLEAAGHGGLLGHSSLGPAVLTLPCTTDGYLL